MYNVQYTCTTKTIIQIVRLCKLIIEKLIQCYPIERIIDGTPCSTYLFPFLHFMYIDAYTYMHIYRSLSTELGRLFVPRING
jgi:hypothetical protein